MQNIDITGKFQVNANVYEPITAEKANSFTSGLSQLYPTFVGWLHPNKIQYDASTKTLKIYPFVVVLQGTTVLVGDIHHPDKPIEVKLLDDTRHQKLAIKFDQTYTPNNPKPILYIDYISFAPNGSPEFTTAWNNIECIIGFFNASTKVWYPAKPFYQSRFFGINADKLDNLDSSQFLRSDVNDNFYGMYTWDKPGGVPFRFDSDCGYIKWIAINDGSGNYTIKSNWDGSSKYLKDDFGAVRINLMTDDVDGRIELHAASKGSAGSSILSHDYGYCTINYNNFIVAFHRALDNTTHASLNVSYGDVYITPSNGVNIAATTTNVSGSNTLNLNGAYVKATAVNEIDFEVGGNQTLKIYKNSVEIRDNTALTWTPHNTDYIRIYPTFPSNDVTTLTFDLGDNGNATNDYFQFGGKDTSGNYHQWLRLDYNALVHRNWICGTSIGNGKKICIGGDGVNPDYEIKLESTDPLSIWSPAGSVKVNIAGRVESSSVGPNLANSVFKTASSTTINSQLKRAYTDNINHIFITLNSGSYTFSGSILPNSNYYAKAIFLVGGVWTDAGDGRPGDLYLKDSNGNIIAHTHIYVWNNPDGSAPMSMFLVTNALNNSLSYTLYTTNFRMYYFYIFFVR